MERIKKITVIGGGSTGFAATAWLTAKGFEVSLCDNESFKPALDAIGENGGILLRGRAGRGLYAPAAVSCRHAEVIPEAELIIICVPARRHAEVARDIAPYVREGQDILISPGNLGSFVFRQVFDELSVTDKVRLSELEGNICPCRLTGPAEVTVGLPIRTKRVACLRGGETGSVIERLEGVFDFLPNKNVFECALLSDNFVLHIGTCILSATNIERMGSEFIMFQHALTPAAITLARAIQKERSALLSRLGLVERDSASEFLEELVDWRNHPEYSVFRTLDGPDSVSHRYIDEDSQACAALALSLAERLGVEMPALAAVVAIAGVLNGVDYLKTGRSLENLGFDGTLGGEEIIRQISS